MTLMSWARLAGSLVAVLLLAGCGPVGELASLLPTDGPNGPTEPGPTLQPTDSLPPTPEYFATCEIMPLADVQAISPLRTEFAFAEPDEGNEERCWYNSSIDPPSEWPNAIRLTLRDMVTAEAAMLSLEDFRDFGNEAYPPVSAVARLGDAAYTYNEGDYRTLVAAVRGRYWAHVDIADSGNLEFPEVPSPEKAAAGTEILRLALSRLP
jgi:hypothetical protein